MVDRLSLLSSSIQRLRLNRDEAVAEFPDFVDLEFELIDDFRSAFMVLPSLIESQALSFSAVAAVVRLSIRIDFQDRNSGVDTLFAKEWDVVRELASEADDLIGVDY